MSPFYAQYQGATVMVIAIVTDNVVPQAVFIYGDGHLGACDVGDIRIDFEVPWRPASWPLWPLSIVDEFAKSRSA